MTEDTSWKNVVYRERVFGLHSWQEHRKFYRKLLRESNYSPLGYIKNFIEYYHILPFNYLKQ